MSSTEDAVATISADEEQPGDFTDAVMTHLAATDAGSILMRNEGGYTARFFVEYKLVEKHFRKDSGSFTIGVNKSIGIPAGATEIRVKAEENWGFGWSTIFSKEFNEPVTRCYKLYGTTLQPKYSTMKCP